MSLETANKNIDIDELKEVEEYWITTLNEIQQCKIPAENHSEKLDLGIEKIHIKSNVANLLFEMCQSQNLSIYVFMQTVLKVLMYKISGQSKITIGTPMYQSVDESSQKVNKLLPLYNIVDKNLKFKDLLLNVKNTTLDVYNKQYYPLGDISKSLDSNEKFNVNLLFETIHSISYVGEYLSNQPSTLNFICIKDKDSFWVELFYNKMSYNKRTICRMLEFYQNILEQVLNNMNCTCSNIELVSTEEKQEIVEGFNSKNIQYQVLENNISELFENNARVYRDMVAIQFNGEKLTYQELNDKVNQLANYLHKQGLKKDMVVGIMLERSLDLVATILAVLKLGSTYLPIDLINPVNRINYMLEDSDASFVITSKFALKGIKLSTNTIVLDREKWGSESTNFTNKHAEDLGQGPAYIIYTSGSTGKPKGVSVEHKAVCNFIDGMARNIPLRENMSILALTSISFDIFFVETIFALVNGIRVVIAKEKQCSNPLAIKELILNHKIDILQMTPSRLRLLLDNEEYSKCLKRVSILLVGGEVFSSKLLNEVKTITDSRIFNLYGPTETTIWSTIKELTNETNVTIGKPLPHYKCYILNKEKNVQPVGEIGELYISGECLAKEYINLPEMTKEKFISNPFVLEERMYKTGDLARWLPNGEIEYIGRNDSQVKINGYRLELEEIEKEYLKFEDVTDVVVLKWGNKDGSSYLCAYIQGKEKILIEQLQGYISRNLPSYMVPKAVIQLDQMPLTINGKLDKKALPNPALVVQKQKEYIEPRDAKERIIAKIWEKVLGFEKIGIEEDFFMLGGNSLKAIQIVNCLENEYSLGTTVSTLFENRTISRLAESIQEKKNNNELISAYPDPLNLHKPFPLTDVQSAYLLGRDDQFELGGVSTHGYYEIETTLDITKFNDSLQKVIERHPMLRAIILPTGEQQILTDVPKYKIEIENIQHLDAVEQELIIKEERERMSHFIFKSDTWPLFEYKAFKISGNRHILCISFDAIIADGISMQIVGSEIMEFYKNPNIRLPQVEISFRDYMLSYQKQKNTDEYMNDREYWLQKLKDFPPAPSLPLLQNPKLLTKPRFNRLQFNLNKKEWHSLKSIAKSMNITPSVLLCTTYAKVLSIWSNVERFALNLTVFNRLPVHPMIEHVVGDFTSLLLMDIELQGEETFSESAQRIQKSLIQALDHKNYDGVEFIREYSKLHELGTEVAMPIVFTSMLTENNKFSWENFGEVKISSFQTSQVYLDYQVMEIKGDLQITWDYVEDLFDEHVIGSMFSQYIEMLHHLVESKDLAQLTLPRIDENIVKQYNQTEKETEKTTLHNLFARQAQKTPDYTAVIMEEESLTYQELHEKSNQVARYLQEKRVGKGSLVGVLAQRCPDTIVNILGILKTGAAYVPVDPEYPQERIDYILNNSQCDLLLTPDVYSKEDLHSCSIEDVENESSPDDIAYIIYTSGSTGKPKGVIITHESAVNTILDMNQKFQVNEDDRFIGLSSICFDLSVYDIFGALSSGASIVQIKDQRDIQEVIETINKYDITIWNSVPAIMDLTIEFIESMKEYQDNELRLVLLSGDWIPLTLPEKIWKYFGEAQINSLGGATEASIWSIYYPINEINPEWKSIPYGMPLANQKFYVLNYAGQVCPVEVEGELYIGGIGLAQGYKNDDTKTKNAFIEHPTFGRLYKTGDHGVLRKEGYIEFLGRKDQQIKIRGYRVELGEVSNQLLEHKNVQQAVVIDQVDSNGKKFLCAYIVVDDEKVMETIREYLAQKLPEYMIPQYFVKLEKLPLTPNGKIDRKVLPEPKLIEDDKSLNIEYPNTEIEKKIGRIWEGVLGISPIDIHSDFLKLGGNSIAMIQVVNSINKEFKINVGIKKFIELRTIFKLSKEIESCKQEEIIHEEHDSKTADWENLYNPFPLTEVQTAYWLGRENTFEMGGVSTHSYVEIETPVNIERLNKALQEMIQRHPMLRGIILPSGEQKILETVPDYLIKVVDLSYLDDKSRQEEIIKERNKMSHHVFDSSQWPLFEFRALKIAENLHILCVSFDLLIMDGASMIHIFSKELLELYLNPNKKLPKLEFTFRDYITEHIKFKNTKKYSTDKAYWLSKLKGFPFAPELPMKQEPNVIKNPKFKRLEYKISRNIWSKLKKIAQSYSITPSVLLCTSYAEILAKWSNQPKLAINTTLFNREPFHEHVNRIIGDFTMISLLDVDFSQGELSFANRAQQLQEVLIEALEHKSYDGIDFVREFSNFHNLNGKAVMPIVFTSMLFPEKEEVDWTDLGEVKLGVSQTSQVYLDYQVMEIKGDLQITWDYVEDLFDEQVIGLMFSQYIDMLHHLVESKDLIQLTLPKVDENIVIKQYNQTEKEIEKTTLHNLFVRQVQKTPDYTAVIMEEESLTYQELHEKSNQVARYLQEKGVGKGSLVGVLAQRCPDTIVNILGILKTGAAYVPVDPEYPQERIDYILNNSQCDLLLTPDVYSKEDLHSCSIEDVENESSPDDIAYIIYTSGSTGKPKGVIITHESAINTILDINQKFQVNEDDRFIGLSSICFDLSVYDIFGALSSGASIVQIKDQRDIQEVIETIDKYGITIWNSVPAIMDLTIEFIESMKEYQDNELRLVLLSGDWIPLILPEKIRKYFGKAQINSLGGATEASIWSIYYPINEINPEWKSIPYGMPLANQKFYVLNYAGQVCPVEVEGELYIGGIGLAQGYKNDDTKTKNAFIEHPTLGRLYKTGDHGVLRKEGYIEFLGRKDQQIKIRGYRVELGEVSNQLLEHKNVQQAVVIDQVDSNGKKFLCAYIVVDDEKVMGSIREYLAQKLPEYMIPQYFVKLEQLPLTPNGKIDRKVLLALEIRKNKLEEKALSC
ncbi:amino acid adenylation domain-containing protein [Bacillus sp. A17A.1]